MRVGVWLRTYDQERKIMRQVVSNTEAEDRIRDRVPFRTKNGALSGQEGWGGPNSFGSLPEEYHADVEGASYIVYSYRTPIAWINSRDYEVIPDVGYSATTGVHQRIVMDAWENFQFPRRNRLVIQAGGGPRGGGMDDPYQGRPAPSYPRPVATDGMRRYPSDSLTVDGDPGVW